MDGPIPELRIQLATVLAVTLPLAVITVFLVRLVFVSLRTKAVTGQAGMVGLTGTASTSIDGHGKVLVHGECWEAHSEAPIPQGARIRVVKMDALKLDVETENEERQ